MMIELLIHLFGDYITQTDWMAKNKTQSFHIAFLHAAVYTLPFLLLSPSWEAIAVICISHAVIDHYRLATHLIFFKNKLTHPSLKWNDCKETGYHKDTPIWLSTWLMIITDNILHLAINHFALKWL
jgi:hypothetical protein